MKCDRNVTNTNSPKKEKDEAGIDISEKVSVLEKDMAEDDSAPEKEVNAGIIKLEPERKSARKSVDSTSASKKKCPKTPIICLERLDISSENDIPSIFKQIIAKIFSR